MFRLLIDVPLSEKQDKAVEISKQIADFLTTTIEEATPLLNELKSLGYNDLQVGKKITRKDRDIRNANRQIW